MATIGQPIKLPAELIEQTDTAIAKIGGYGSRSEYVRDAVRRRNLQILEGSQ